MRGNPTADKEEKADVFKPGDPDRQACLSRVRDSYHVLTRRARDVRYAPMLQRLWATLSPAAKAAARTTPEWHAGERNDGASGDAAAQSSPLAGSPSGPREWMTLLPSHTSEEARCVEWKDNRSSVTFLGGGLASNSSSRDQEPALDLRQDLLFTITEDEESSRQTDGGAADNTNDSALGEDDDEDEDEDDDGEDEEEGDDDQEGETGQGKNPSSTNKRAAIREEASQDFGVSCLLDFSASGSCKPDSRGYRGLEPPAKRPKWSHPGAGTPLKAPLSPPGLPFACGGSPGLNALPMPNFNLSPGRPLDRNPRQG